MSEISRLREVLSKTIKDESSLDSVFSSAAEIADSIDAIGLMNKPTGLALGYVQSGKTTSMTTLAAECSDRGYNLVIALLGVTNLLLSQNTSRLLSDLGIETRVDYKWVSIVNPAGSAQSARDIGDWIDRGRTVIIPVLKNALRVKNVAATLERIPDVSHFKCLIIDDEADQASLNTLVRTGDESATFAAIDRLRQAIPSHAYIQYTATPYAPLLLDTHDPLFPKFVTFLEPGVGYTGGRSFFIDHSETVIRYVPASEEQGSKLPIELPQSLQAALWNFLIGSAILDAEIAAARPISMLIHPSSRKDVQDRYQFLLNRALTRITGLLSSPETFSDLDKHAELEYQRLVANGVPEIEFEDLVSRLRYVIGQIKVWLVHSASSVKQIDWNLTPFHILIGGNKLDRGFTVEGLTVTYMNRPSSEQVDTIEQRARAFGYRAEFLPYCQFFASARTVKMLREIVTTEYDLRSRLLDAVKEGRSIAEWSREIGLLLPEGARATRENVVTAVSHAPTGWRQWRRPVLEESAVAHNWQLMKQIGLLDAPLVDYQRLRFRTIALNPSKTLETLKSWNFGSQMSRWEFDEWIKLIERQIPFQEEVKFILIQQDSGTANQRARTRSAYPEEGYVNLFQGRDLKPQPNGTEYPGDREIWPIQDAPSEVLIQIHNVRPKQSTDERLLTPAIYLGDRRIAKKER